MTQILFNYPIYYFEVRQMEFWSESVMASPKPEKPTDLWRLL